MTRNDQRQRIDDMILRQLAAKVLAECLRLSDRATRGQSQAACEVALDDYLRRFVVDLDRQRAAMASEGSAA